MDEDQVRELFFEVTDHARAEVDVSARVRAGLREFVNGLPEDMRIRDVKAALEANW